ncbi:MAG: hypothetical protein JRG97_03930 [Deltaproteobacteria bacterium]|nr:hypothetical protein [Deltaproteobacteria bacterium]MBW2051683.1 hypothetical protein [Deltaproteobacteria bacterium]MBW2140205.1 hypothetical protein [Deltaproteobacteria bacterium]MBW2323907.1 hypothetical protein [Deltaproteobacteria bacterium]
MKKVKKLYGLICFLAIFLTVSGMSSIEGDSPEGVPVPAKKFSAIIVDQADVRSEVDSFSIDGFTFISGNRGKGTFSIAFDKLESIDFRFLDERLEALINLKEGRTIALEVDKNLDCYGRTDFGTYRIKLGDIKRLVIETRSKPTY